MVAERSGPFAPLGDVDVAGVAEALGDGNTTCVWWYDPASGQVEMGLAEWIAEDLDEDEDDPFDRGLVRIDAEGSGPAYDDMVDFANAVGDRRAADLLQRALPGRGAFRRFRDTLLDFPKLQEHWETYAAACAAIRAIEWLSVEGYVDSLEAHDAVRVRTATAAAVIAIIGHGHEMHIEAMFLRDRWRDVERAIDAGRDVVVLRDGAPWALITRA